MSIITSELLHREADACRGIDRGRGRYSCIDRNKVGAGTEAVAEAKENTGIGTGAKIIEGAGEAAGADLHMRIQLQLQLQVWRQKHG